MKQYSITVEGQEIGFVENTNSHVYDSLISTGQRWVRNQDGSYKGERTAGNLRRINGSSLSHTFHSRHPEFSHLDGKRAIVSVAPIYDSKEAQ